MSENNIENIPQNGVTTAENRRQFVVSPREMIFKYLRYLPLVIICLSIALIVAYVKLRYATRIYSVAGKMLVKNDNPYGGGSGEKFDDIFMMPGASSNQGDEIEVIKSRTMASRVVKRIGLQTQYYTVGNIRTSASHSAEMPFYLDITYQADSTEGHTWQVNMAGRNKFRLGENPKVYDFGQLIQEKNIHFRFISKGDLAGLDDKKFIITWSPLEGVASGLSGSIGVAQVGDFTNVLALNYNTENIRIGVDVINAYMQEYMLSRLEDKREIAVNTLDFIDEQLDTVKLQLGGAERNLQQFREQQKVFNTEEQSLLFINELADNNKMRTEQGVKIKVIDYLTEVVTNNKIVYSVLGIEEPTLVEQITEYNNLQLQREKDLKTTPADNPLIKNYDAAIAKLRSDILGNLQNVRNTYMLTVGALDRRLSSTSAELSSIPGKEKQLLEATRAQRILQELYSFLLQKKLETSIASASTISNTKVLEGAMASYSPIAPKRSTYYTMAMFVGLFIPVIVIFLIEYLNDKVKTKGDIEKGTDAPILGEIGHAEDFGALVVTRNNRRFIAEQFRIIRTNLQYIVNKIEKPIIMVTSSFSGEGKSFVSTNMGAVMALTGKRTVILELDIRKPKIMSGLELTRGTGITNYIVGNARLDELPLPVPKVDNLFVIPCGPVPPNPAELLLDPKLKDVFDYARSNFDVVIVDTAPVGLVSDSIVLGALADCTLYIVRQKYTLKRQIALIDDMYRNKKLPKVSILVNDVKTVAGYGGYYGGYGYGYGYGYGHGYGYGGYYEEEKKKSWFKKMLKKK